MKQRSGERLSTSGERGSWAVVIAEPGGRASVAERSIQALGYTVDFLWYRRIVERRVVTDGHTRKRMPLEDCIERRALFERYGFVMVEIGHDAGDIDAAPGVTRLLRHAPPLGDRIGLPKIVRASIVDRLRTAAAAGEFDDPRLKSGIRGDLKPGDQVRRVGDTLVMRLKELDQEGRAKAIADLLGRDVEISIDDATSLELVR